MTLITLQPPLSSKSKTCFVTVLMTQTPFSYSRHHRQPAIMTFLRYFRSYLAFFHKVGTKEVTAVGSRGKQTSSTTHRGLHPVHQGTVQTWRWPRQPRADPRRQRPSRWRAQVYLETELHNRRQKTEHRARFPPAHYPENGPRQSFRKRQEHRARRGHPETPTAQTTDTIPWRSFRRS